MPLLNTLRLNGNDCHMAKKIFKCIFFNEKVWILIQISLKFIPKGPINNKLPDNGLSPNRWQAIISTIDGLDYWCIYASPGLNGLTHWILRHNGRHFPDDIFKSILLNENVSISLKIHSKFVPKVWFNNVPELVQIMACTWLAPSHYLNQWWLVCWYNVHTCICVTQPQWVKIYQGYVTHICVSDLSYLWCM